MAVSLETQIPVELEAPEQAPHSPEEIAAAFKAAHDYLYTVTDDDEFQLACMDRNVDPDNDMDKPIYWRLLAKRSQDLIEAKREKNGDSTELRAKELVCVTPAVMFEIVRMKSDTEQTKVARDFSKRSAAYYNELVRNFAIYDPATRVSTMNKALVGVANSAIEGRHMRQFAAHEIASTLRGAQSEIGFLQILSHTDHKFRPTNQQEDLEGGDIAIEDDGKALLYVDAKSTLTSIKNERNPYMRIDDEHIRMYAYTQEAEFNDTFFISDELAKARAAKVGSYITQAQRPAA